MSKLREDRQKDLLLPGLDEFIGMGHPLVRLAAVRCAKPVRGS